MKYCTKCWYPDTKPDLTFNENGVCSACTAFEERKNIDWGEREKQFCELAAKIRISMRDSPYDCIVPVSGGKDSHYQTIKVMEYGLKPLAITAITDDLSDIGMYNLINIHNLGCDHVFVATDGRLRNRIARYALETIGDISWAEHVTIFTIPISEAILRDIPCVIYGENPQNEYGGPSKESQNTANMNKRWLNEFGGLNGLRIQDIIDVEIATKKEMYQYIGPKITSESWPECIFLGQYFDWDGYENANIAADHGFIESKFPVEASGFCYENLDNYQTGIHDRFKYLKFGFGRATDICNNHIRRGRMTRKDALDHIRNWDIRHPDYYLDKSLSEILKPLGLTVSDYMTIENKFANPDLFEVFSGGYKYPKPKFIIGEDA